MINSVASWKLELRDFTRARCKCVTNHYNGLPQEGACDLIVLSWGLGKTELKLYVLGRGVLVSSAANERRTCRYMYTLVLLYVRLFSKLSMTSHIIHLSNFRSWLRMALPSCLSMQEKMRPYCASSKNDVQQISRFVKAYGNVHCKPQPAGPHCKPNEPSIYVLSSHKQLTYFKSAVKLC